MPPFLQLLFTSPDSFLPSVATETIKRGDSGTAALSGQGSPRLIALLIRINAAPCVPPKRPSASLPAKASVKALCDKLLSKAKKSNVKKNRSWQPVLFYDGNTIIVQYKHIACCCYLIVFNSTSALRVEGRNLRSDLFGRKHDTAVPPRLGGENRSFIGKLLRVHRRSKHIDFVRKCTHKTTVYPIAVSATTARGSAG